MKEQSLVLIKPDAVQRNLIGEIIQRIEQTGIKIIAMKMVYASEELAGKHYQDDEDWLKEVGEKAKEENEDAIEAGKRIRSQLMDFISMSPVVALAAEGHNAIDKIRQIVGETSPSEAQPGTIRGDYSHETYEMADKQERAVQNLVHASDSPEEGQREIKVWFDKEELHNYMKLDEELFYGGDNHA